MGTEVGLVGDDELAAILGNLRHLHGEFRLRSGAVASTYFDKYRFEAEPAVLKAVADRLAALVPPGTEVLAGLFYILEQLPVIAPTDFYHPCRWDTSADVAGWVTRRVAELVFTAEEMAPFAEDIGFVGRPFVWEPARRAALRAELDAAFFHLYGLDRADTEYVLSTFPIANRNDPDLTPRILREYDSMQKAIDSGEPYVSPLDPPPGHGARHASVN